MAELDRHDVPYAAVVVRKVLASMLQGDLLCSLVVAAVSSTHVIEVVVVKPLEADQTILQGRLAVASLACLVHGLYAVGRAHHIEMALVSWLAALGQPCCRASDMQTKKEDIDSAGQDDLKVDTWTDLEGYSNRSSDGQVGMRIDGSNHALQESL